MRDQAGYGHCSTAMSSLCTARTIRDYFVKGKLPDHDLVCKTDEVLFPPPASAAGSSSPFSAAVQGAAAWSVEDRELMEGMWGMEAAVASGGFRGIGKGSWGEQWIA